MWLLNTHTARLKDFHSPRGLRYAILSHVWQEGEQTFQNVQELSSREKPIDDVCEKIRECCKVAARDGFEWLWIDTCCINKTSSSELSEAINSMYAWYAKAAICYAYLYDVDDQEDPSQTPSSFRSSRWFTRGWTLRELIAPNYVVFLSSTWHAIGTKQVYAQLIEEIAGVNSEVLMHTRSLDQVSIARRMSWAAKRETTREEDRAYSLMGIFGVYMPTIYGEGRNAFVRLQEEILRRTPDQSLFIWGPRIACKSLNDLISDDDLDPPESAPRALLATTPANFLGCGGISPITYELLAQKLNLRSPKLPEYRLTSYGLRTELPFVTFEAASIARTKPKRALIVVLACQNEEDALAVLFLRLQPDAVGRYFVGACVNQQPPASNPPVSPHSSRPPYYRVGFLPVPLITSLSRMRIEAEHEVIFHPFDLSSARDPRLELPPQDKADEQPACPSFAFFIPHRAVQCLRAFGFHPDKEPSHDGILFETNWGSETTVSFTTSGDDSAREQKDVQGSAASVLDEVKREPHVTFAITIGTSCSCQPGDTSDTSLPHQPWFAVERTVVRNNPDPDVECPSRRESQAGPDVPPPLPRSACQIDRAHLPANTPTPTLVFSDGALCRVVLRFRLWENCHRSRAQTVYMLEVDVLGPSSEDSKCPGGGRAERFLVVGDDHYEQPASTAGHERC